MVISKIIRPKKTTLNNYIETTTKTKKVPIRNRVIEILKHNKKGLTLNTLSEMLHLTSAGNLHLVLNILTRTKIVIKHKCPHCDTTILYKLT